MSDPAPPGRFQRQLGLFDATMLIAGTMVGSGIFLVSAGIARDVGSSGWLLAVWALTGVMTVIGALAYAELAAMMPEAGGQYVYLRDAYSPLVGFLHGWTAFVVIQTGTIAAVAVAFGNFLGALAPAWGVGEAAVLFRHRFAAPVELYLPLPWLGEPLKVFARTEFTITRGQLVGVGLIAALTALNCRGVREGKIVQNVFGVVKLSALAALIVLGLAGAAGPSLLGENLRDPWGGIYSTDAVAAVQQTAGAPALLAALMVAGAAMVGSLFSADAWGNVTYTAAEVKDPRRTLPLSLALGVTLVITLYLLANLAYLNALPLEGIAGAPDNRVGTAVMELVWPGWGGALMAVAVMISTFGCLNGLVLMGARLYYAMARDGLFFRAVGGLNSRGVPAVGLVLQGVWASALVFSGTYNELLDYVIFAALLFYALTVGGLFILRRKRPDAERPYRAFGYPVLPGLYVVLCALLLLTLLVVRPVFTWPGLALVLTGIPVYFLWRLRTLGRDDTVGAK